MSQVETSAGEAELKAADRFVIDSRSSRLTVRTFASGILAAMGHNPTIGIREFSGEVKFDPEQLKAGDFRLDVKSRSLTVEDDISGKDRREIEGVMHEEVLETGKFPEIHYEAAGISVAKVGDTLYSASLQGKLTLRGVTRAEPIAARVALIGSMLRASGEFSLNQSKYDIKPVSVAGGVLKLKDELRFQFEIIARRWE
jgi:polyisoprenoid-binding protein YceI